MDVYLIDGTYELFRHFYALPSETDDLGREVAAVRGVIASIRGMTSRGVTHLGVATDRIIESFRNELWPGYKTSEGIDPALWSQFPILEGALVAMGIVLWPMVEFEADDALATAAVQAAADLRVGRVVICTPDKDLAQCVRGTRIVQLNRRTRVIVDEKGVTEKFGVPPPSIPDYLALVGDAADGYPGIPGIGAVTAARLVNKHGSIEQFPPSVLGDKHALAQLFKNLATLRTDAALFRDVDELGWRGPGADFTKLAQRIDSERLVERSEKARLALS